MSRIGSSSASGVRVAAQPLSNVFTVLLLIGALARETGSLVWSLDADFERMSGLGFVDLYEP
mgnify:CR=1 FL=1